MREKSREVYEASLGVIPGGVNSPVRAFKGLDMTPLVAVSGNGDTLLDADGHRYVDFCCSWGALILGHAHPKVVAAVCRQMEKSSSFGIITPYEEELASRIIKHYPSVEKIRFTSSGTEATMSALRLARGYTGRPYIVKFNGNYHGHVDSLLVQAGSGVTHLTPTSSSKGILNDTIQYTISLPYNDCAACKAVFEEKGDEIAAVIFEPIAGNMGLVPATQEFHDMLREETRKRGIVLIFDEVITGFRAALDGAQGIYGIDPDLTCFGKVIGGGFPCAAFGGKKEIMDHLAPLGRVYHGGTLSGNPVAMCAGLATLEEIEKEGFYAELERKADVITKPIQEMIAAKGLNACIQQVGSGFTLFLGCQKVTCSEDLKTLDEGSFKCLFVDLFHQGIYIPPSPYETWFVSSAHQESNLEKTRDAILSFLDKM
ncbi:MAG: glutamate-1-semialdehyde 2,1-aminomutase [Chlamydiota bacterium]